MVLGGSRVDGREIRRQEGCKMLGHRPTFPSGSDTARHQNQAEQYLHLLRSGEKMGGHLQSPHLHLRMIPPAVPRDVGVVVDWLLEGKVAYIVQVIRPQNLRTRRYHPVLLTDL